MELNWDMQGWNWVSWGSWQQEQLRGQSARLQQCLQGHRSSSMTQAGLGVSVPASPLFSGLECLLYVLAFCPSSAVSDRLHP